MPTSAAINYVELPAPDIEASKAFYAAAFDWAWIDYGPTYAGTDMSSGNLAVEVGLSRQATALVPHAPGEDSAIGPFVLFGTADIESSLVAVQDAGGIIHTPIVGYPGGRRFHFRDPGGNVLGVYQSNAPSDA